MNRLVIFDLDGTITRHDTFLPYLRGWLRRHSERLLWLPVAAAIIRFIVGGRDRGRLKSDLIRAWMAGASEAEVDAWSDEFVAALGAAEFCPGALAAIEHHRTAGDRLVLLSASVDLYVPRIGARLGFDESICTGVVWTEGRLDGALSTPNRRASEKRRCVEALRLRFPGAAIAAYGNSGSDLAHLEAVEYPVLVNAGWRARRAAARRRIPIAEWRNKPAARPVQSS